MAFPPNVPVLPGGVPEGMSARRLFRGPFLWDTIFPSPRSEDEIPLTEEDWWYPSDILLSLGRACEMTTNFETFSLGPEFSLDEEALTCTHGELSFDNILSPEAVARCLHVACVICLNCVLFWFTMKSKCDSSAKIDQLLTMICDSDSSAQFYQLSRVCDKWKWSGESRRRTFNQWNHYIDDADADQETMELLFQWTADPVGILDREVQAAMDGVCNDDYDEVIRVSKCGEDLCNLLKAYRRLFATADTEFVYLQMLESHTRTALLHRTLGNYERGEELLKALKTMLEGIGKFNLNIAECVKPGKIVYKEPDRVYVFGKKIEINTILESQGSVNDKYSKLLSEEREDLARKRDLLIGAYWNTPRFVDQIDFMVHLLNTKRFGETREIFKLLDLKQILVKARFREFLELKAIASSIHGAGSFFYDTRSESTSDWESYCENQDLFLEFCKALGERHLTPIYLQQYAVKLMHRSYVKLCKTVANDTSRLKLLL